MSKAPILLIVVGLSAALLLLAKPQQGSLGDLARQVRAQRERESKQPVKVFTNDNLPAPPPWEKAPAATPGPPQAPTGEKTNPVQPATNPPESAEQKSTVTPESPEGKVKTRDYWQAKFKDTRARLAQAREQEQLVEDELNLLQIQQARELDPNARLELETRARGKQAEVDARHAATDAAKNALNDLEREFTESGAPGDWSNTN
jgi:type IV secretory pathway VirB10-like protein